MSFQLYYVLYARAQGNDPQIQRKLDSRKGCSDSTVPFFIWLNARKLEFGAEKHILSDYAALVQAEVSGEFENWLCKKFPAKGSEVNESGHRELRVL